MRRTDEPRDTAWSLHGPCIIPGHLNAPQQRRRDTSGEAFGDHSDQLDYISLTNATGFRVYNVSDASAGFYTPSTGVHALATETESGGHNYEIFLPLIP